MVVKVFDATTSKRRGRDRTARTLPPARRRRRSRRSRRRSGRRRGRAHRPAGPARAPTRRCRYGGCGGSAPAPRPRSRRSARASGRGSACACATLSGAPSPRSAVCSAARPSVTLTTSPANSASRLPARSHALASASNAASAVGVRWVFDQSKWMPATSSDSLREPVGIGGEQFGQRRARQRLDRRSSRPCHRSSRLMRLQWASDRPVTTRGGVRAP